MRAFISIAVLAAVLSAVAAPTAINIPITKVPGPVKANSYIMYVQLYQDLPERYSHGDIP